MKRVSILVALALVAVGMNAVQTGKVEGRNEYFKQFQKDYKDSKVIDKVKKEKCNTCHYGKSKKNRNDYGTELSKHLTKDLRKKMRRKKDEFNEIISESLKKVEKEKSVHGDTFGERIKNGELPGTPPEEEEED